MKALLNAIILIIVICSDANAQSIVGIGDLKIGMSEQDFLNSKEIRSKEIKDPKNKDEVVNEQEVWKQTTESVIPEKYSKSTTYKIYIKDLTRYEYRMEIGVKNESGKDSYLTTLDFYKGELVKIKIDISDSYSLIKDILAQKYGMPTEKNSMGKSICQNSNGVKVEHKEGIIIWDWMSKSDIEATMFIHSYNCGKLVGQTYMIQDKKKNSIITNLQKISRAEAMSEDLKQKSSNSKL